MSAKIKKLLEEYQLKKPDIEKRLMDFRNVPECDYFYELVYCLFTPQTKAQHSYKVTEEMKRLGYFQKPFPLKKLLHQKDGTYIRFHNQKEKYVILARKNFDLILSKINEELPINQKREWLIKNVLGLSLKESTHFLRNIGLNENLAILDRHILTNLLKYNVIKEIPKTLTAKIYLDIEYKFQAFSKKTGININSIDLLFWSNQTGIILK
jgi:N-glycosylase/DNA lyase